jgi:putative tryptophan/tyrosine transport system permease protein
MSWLVPIDIGVSMGLIFAWGVLALALSFRLLSFPDLTIEGSFPLGAAVFASLLKSGFGLPVAIMAALLAGAAVGGLTAFLHLRFKINKFLAGIIVVAIAYSLSLRVMGASNIGLFQASTIFDFFAPLDSAFGGTFHAGTILLLVAILVAGALLIILGLSSRHGMRMRVAGSNPEYARGLGISVNWNLILGLAVTNGLAALSGVLLAMHQGFADIGMGQGVLILALAALTIGERLTPESSLPFHSFVVLAAVFGSIIYQIIVVYAIRFGLAPTDLKLVTAVLVLLIVALRISRDGEIFEEGLK